jgi:rSAM/selenodomain-associated transferase 1
MIADMPLNSCDASRVSLVLVAKQPIPGRVKTRLTPELSAQSAAYVHKSLLRHTRRTCEQLAAKSRFIDLVLLFDPPGSPAVWNDWTLWRRMPQTDGDLGRRLESARSALANQYCAGCVFIGADAPELSGHHLIWASQEVRRSRYAMIPAHDGGYVLLGIPAGTVSLFQSVSWGTSQVAHQTRQMATRQGAAISELPALHDIDTYADLTGLLERLATNTRDGTAAALRQKLTEIVDGKQSDHGNMTGD